MGPNLPRNGCVVLRLRLRFLTWSNSRALPQAPAMAKVAKAFEATATRRSVDQALHGTGAERSKRSKCAAKSIRRNLHRENGAEYPKSPAGQRLQQMAR